MPNSMTGFGSAREKVQGMDVAVEVRSVNHRSLKIQTRLNDRLRSLAPAIEKLIRQSLQRGSVTAGIDVKTSEDALVENLDIDVLQGYIRRLAPLVADNENKLVLDVSSLIDLPGVMDERQPVLDDDVIADLVALFQEALDKLVAMRETEGRLITDELKRLSVEIRTLLQYIRGHADDVTRRYHERLRKRAAELAGLSEMQIDGESLAREVAFIAEKCDIAEELTRFDSHLNQFEETLAEEGPAGRKLDFLAQEMFREANTIASKTQDSDISAVVVTIKTAVDRIKEQAANLE